MKRLILTIILGILMISLTGCISYRHHHPRGRQVVVVTKPKRPPMPPAPPRRPRGHRAPSPPMPKHDHHKF